jgi:hypothetical protein
MKPQPDQWVEFEHATKIAVASSGTHVLLYKRAALSMRQQNYQWQNLQ